MSETSSPSNSTVTTPTNSHMELEKRLSAGNANNNNILHRIDPESHSADSSHRSPHSGAAQSTQVTPNKGENNRGIVALGVLMYYQAVL